MSKTKEELLEQELKENEDLDFRFREETKDEDHIDLRDENLDEDMEKHDRDFESATLPDEYNQH